MLLHITDKCTMGCPHCIGDYKPDGGHMTKEVFSDALDFIFKTNEIVHIVITGGEPTEHPQFVELLELLFGRSLKHYKPIPSLVTITTNGFWCLEHPDEARRIAHGIPSMAIQVEWQVSADKRYYPKRLDVDNPLFKEDGFTLCDDCVTRIYPQGRAVDNNIPFQAKAPKCFNLRSIVKSVSSDSSIIQSPLSYAVMGLLMRGYSCTPSIGINGEIKLGESKLCPTCASIYDDIPVIEDKIRKFHCHNCEHLLSEEMIKYING